jgi:hypothetical protein
VVWEGGAERLLPIPIEAVEFLCFVLAEAPPSRDFFAANVVGDERMVG